MEEARRDRHGDKEEGGGRGRMMDRDIEGGPSSTFIEE